MIFYVGEGKSEESENFIGLQWRPIHLQPARTKTAQDMCETTDQRALVNKKTTSIDNKNIAL